MIVDVRGRELREVELSILRVKFIPPLDFLWDFLQGNIAVGRLGGGRGSFFRTSRSIMNAFDIRAKQTVTIKACSKCVFDSISQPEMQAEVMSDKTTQKT